MLTIMFHMSPSMASNNEVGKEVEHSLEGSTENKEIESDSTEHKNNEYNNVSYEPFENSFLFIALNYEVDEEVEHSIEISTKVSETENESTKHKENVYDNVSYELFEKNYPFITSNNEDGDIEHSFDGSTKNRAIEIDSLQRINFANKHLFGYAMDRADKEISYRSNHLMSSSKKVAEEIENSHKESRNEKQIEDDDHLRKSFANNHSIKYLNGQVDSQPRSKFDDSSVHKLNWKYNSISIESSIVGHITIVHENIKDLVFSIFNNSKSLCYKT